MAQPMLSIEPDGNPPSLGDVVDVPELLRTLQDSLRQTLSTRLGMIWEEQHRVQCRCGDGSCMLCDDNGTLPATSIGAKVIDVTIDRALFDSIVSELARNTAQALMGLTVEAEPI